MGVIFGGGREKSSFNFSVLVILWFSSGVAKFVNSLHEQYIL